MLAGGKSQALRSSARRRRGLRIPIKQKNVIVDLLTQFDEGQKRDPAQYAERLDEVRHMRAALPMDRFMAYYFLGKKKELLPEERASIA